MKLAYIRLADKGMQTKHGRLGSQHITSDHYDLTLISNLRVVKVAAHDWNGGSVYIPLERLDNYSPLPEPVK